MSELITNIENKIYIINNQRVMLDSDLAFLYNVETKRLLEQVRRNIERFPNDFMIRCNSNSLDDLRSQIATAKSPSNWNHKTRSMPYLFTENGIAMLSSVINSKEAIQVNIQIMRLFTQFRNFLLLENRLESKIDGLESKTAKVFKKVFEKMDSYEEKLRPIRKQGNKKIGLKT